MKTGKKNTYLSSGFRREPLDEPKMRTTTSATEIIMDSAISVKTRALFPPLLANCCPGCLGAGIKSLIGFSGEIGAGMCPIG